MKAKLIVEIGIKLLIYENKEIYNIMCLQQIGGGKYRWRKWKSCEKYALLYQHKYYTSNITVYTRQDIQMFSAEQRLLPIEI
jgi:hypothetical protein